MKQLIASLCVVALALPALAIGSKDFITETENENAQDRVDCDVTDCESYMFTVGAEFDDTAGLLRYGPLTTGGSCVITNVVLGIEITQTWVGDLIIDLYYDEDGDGVYDYGPVSALCRPQLDGCPLEDCCGCSGDLAGLYTFGDDGADPLGEYDCPGAIPTGCYQPAIESPAGFAATFGGATAGGDFYVEIGDGAAGDATAFHYFSVWVCCGTTEAGESSWSQVKVEY